MDSLHSWQTKSASPAATEKLAAKLGRQLKGGEVIELVGDLGSGKTTFVRGLARGMGSHDVVASPTFTLSRLYNAGQISLNHFDFYRLGEAGIMTREIDEFAKDKNSVTVVEWGDVASPALPRQRLVISFMPSGETSRKIVIRYPESLNKIIEALK